MKTIKAIETWYRGSRFRSRLEARWAVFFQNLGIEWLYEPEGYVLPSGGAYLPDFYLPKLDLFVEIKPTLDVITHVPRVYLAGPMDMRRGGWREKFSNIDTSGPDVSADHRFAPVLHGDDVNGDTKASDIVSTCFSQINECDELWAWIPDATAFGTLCEIGYAAGLDKRIRVAFHEDAMVPHDTASSVGSFNASNMPRHGFQSHEMWFVETVANHSITFAKSVDEVASAWCPVLSEEERKCADLSCRAPVVMACGLPGETKDQCVYFHAGKRAGRFIPRPWLLGDTRAAIAAARGARFEHGEKG